MKIGIISDIHGIFPLQVKRFLQDTDEIWCLGDIWTPDIYEEIINIGIPVIAITGNWEEEQDSPLTKILKPVEHIQREGLNIMLSHKNWGYERHYDENGGIDLHCYGHIHRFSFDTKKLRKDGKPTYCLNPGAVTPLYEQISSAVTLEISNGHIQNFRRLAIDCDIITNKEHQYAGVFNKVPPDRWLYTMFGKPSFEIGLMDNEDDTFNEWKELLSDNLNFGTNKGKYIAKVFNEKNSNKYGGAFVDYDETTGIISVNGFSQIIECTASPGMLCYYIEKLIQDYFKNNNTSFNYSNLNENARFIKELHKKYLKNESGKSK